MSSRQVSSILCWHNFHSGASRVEALVQGLSDEEVMWSCIVPAEISGSLWRSNYWSSETRPSNDSPNFERSIPVWILVCLYIPHANATIRLRLTRGGIAFRKKKGTISKTPCETTKPTMNCWALLVWVHIIQKPNGQESQNSKDKGIQKYMFHRKKREHHVDPNVYLEDQ